MNVWRRILWWLIMPAVVVVITVWHVAGLVDHLIKTGRASSDVGNVS